MNANEFPVLKITNITWDKDHDEFEKLPKEVELNWGTKTWNIDEVSNWLSIKFDWVFNSLNILLYLGSRYPSPESIPVSEDFLNPWSLPILRNFVFL